MSVSAAEPHRTQALPERRVAEVHGVRRLGAYDLITARDPVDAPGPRPGQFYMLATGDRWGAGAGERPFLPRAFSHATARPHPGGGAELEFLLEDVGPGTHRLGELVAGDALMLLGPLGAGFRPPVPDTRALLVGGGIGVAPLLCLHRELGGGDQVLLGFRSAAHAAAAELFGGGAQVVTEDGSAGTQGLVTEPLAAELDGDHAATVFACGPPAMLEAVRALCAQRGVDCQLALESGMACGFGACFGCVVETLDGYQRVCVEGPVFAGSQLARVT
ncbi:MAG: dihydroorotate dehydrogenase electron transfer subunit [Thermoleophilaceae bacterium]